MQRCLLVVGCNRKEHIAPLIILWCHQYGGLTLQQEIGYAYGSC